MNNFSSSKILYHTDRLIDHRPITADIFLTNYCNNKCPYCIYHRWSLDNGAQAMSKEEFVRYAERLKQLGVQGFILTGGGEPTLNPDFDSIVQWLEENHLHYGINTNFNVLKFFAPDYLKISLDGWDEDSYECSRGVRKYRKVIENIYAYDAWRKEHAKRTTLGIQKVVSNADDIKKFYNANANLPVDYISMRPIESTCGSFYKNANNRVDAAACIEAICRLRDFDPRVVFSPKWEMIDEPTAQGCPAHWAQLSLNEKGEVMHCCHKPYQIVGHIMDEDIMQRHKQSFTDVRSCDMPCRLSSANACMETLRVGVKDAYFL